MLGEISPHHDYCDSKSSSETPPSYNQLNYNENIQRFFQSKPKTTVSDENIDCSMERKIMSPIEGVCSNDGNNHKMIESVTNSYKPSRLTEELLIK